MDDIFTSTYTAWDEAAQVEPVSRRHLYTTTFKSFGL